MKDQRSANNLFLLSGEVRWQIYELLIYSTNWIVSKYPVLYMLYERRVTVEKKGSGAWKDVCEGFHIDQAWF
jgi:hypothetical protein